MPAPWFQNNPYLYSVAAVIVPQHYILKGVTDALFFDTTMQELVNIDATAHIKDLIYTVRGVKVMLDADLAEIYGYQTSRFNQQVKNNIEKFDADFRFQLTKEEYQQILKSKFLTSNYSVDCSDSDDNKNDANLISKNLTSSWGGNRKLPCVFTEQGVYMLMTVLKGD